MVCVDASVAVKWIFIEDRSVEARALLRMSLREEEPLIAPPHLRIEVTNVIRQRIRQGGIALPEGRDLLAEFLAVRVSSIELSELYERALIISERHGVPSAYDSQYLALAEMLGCAYWTDDQRLLRTLRGALPFVFWIGDFKDQ